MAAIHLGATPALVNSLWRGYCVEQFMLAYVFCTVLCVKLAELTELKKSTCVHSKPSGCIEM